jgi:diguanylate cyclase (GGDEF)-like protein/PAS domain S-box-containing protein
MGSKNSRSDYIETSRFYQRPHDLFEEVEAMAGIGYWEWDEINDNCTYCSEQLARMHGVSVEEFLTRATSMDEDLEWVHPDDRDYYREKTRQLRKTEQIVELEYRILPTGGGEIHVRERGMAVVDEAGVHVRSYGFIQDITDLKAAENALKDLHHRQESVLEERTAALKTSEERFAFAISSAKQGVWEWDMETGFNYMSEPWKIFLGYTDEDLPNGPDLFARIVHPDDSRKIDKNFRAHIKDRVPFDFSLRMVHKNGSCIWIRAHGHAVWDDNNRAIKMGGTVSDITEYRKLLDTARYNAEHDQLTGLYNRHYFARIADDTLEQHTVDCAACGIAILDLDGFKEINDSHGHPAGDSILVTLAERLVRLVDNNGIVIRLGGDEFAVVFHLHNDEEDPQVFFERLLGELARPVSWNGFMFECTGSLGLALAGSGDGTNATELLQRADLALYDAKETGGNRIGWFTEDLLTAAVKRTNILTNARRALSEDRYTLCFQPKSDLRSMRLSGFEALLRRREDDGSLSSPGGFMEVFEDSALACRIGEFVRHQAVTQAAAWKSAGFDFGHIAFNISHQEFQAYQGDTSYAGALLASIADAGLAPEDIQVEITEDVLLTSGRKSATDTLGYLRETGVKVALDDFGTGHASLIHLKEAEFDLIKLDVSFVRAMLTSKVDMAIVETLCDLAARLGKEVVAEGIETAEQLETLKQLGVTYGQGYLIGRPMPADRARETAERPPVRPDPTTL